MRAVLSIYLSSWGDDHTATAPLAPESAALGCCRGKHLKSSASEVLLWEEDCIDATGFFVLLLGSTCCNFLFANILVHLSFSSLVSTATLHIRI